MKLDTQPLLLRDVSISPSFCLPLHSQVIQIWILQVWICASSDTAIRCLIEGCFKGGPFYGVGDVGDVVGCVAKLQSKKFQVRYISQRKRSRWQIEQMNKSNEQIASNRASTHTNTHQQRQANGAFELCADHAGYRSLPLSLYYRYHTRCGLADWLAFNLSILSCPG